jgi:hypothetical protein
MCLKKKSTQYCHNEASKIKKVQVWTNFDDFQILILFTSNFLTVILRNNPEEKITTICKIGSRKIKSSRLLCTFCKTLKVDTFLQTD